MKIILSLIISGALVVSGFGQTRNVLVGTNNTVVQPTNFWSADASNARSGLGLGSAATNPASAFQPSSSALSNIVSGDGSSLSNLAASNIVGVLTLSRGGTSATNAESARSSLGLSFSALTNTNSSTFRSAIELSASWLTNTNITNFRSAILPSYSGNTNKVLAVNSSGTDIEWITQTGGGGITSGVIAITNGGTGATNAAQARTNLGLGATWLTNTDATNFRSAIGLGATNDVTFKSVNYDGELTINNASILGWNAEINFEETRFSYGAYGAVNIFDWGISNKLIVGLPIEFANTTNAATTRTNLGLGATWLTNTNTANFRTAIGLGATNDVTFNVGTFNGPVTFNEDVYGSYFEAVSGGTNGVTLQTAGMFFFGTAAATTRTNLGLGWQALTNSNAGTGLVSVNTNGEVVSPTNFWQQAPIATTVAFSAPATNSTNTATNSRNLIIQSLSSNIVNTTNTLLLPTNTSTFNGDTAVVIHAGGSGSATAIFQAGSATNLIVLTNFDHAVRFLYFNNAWDFYHNLAYVEPIYFSGTNAVANAAASRTNLSLGATWLTNTNVTNFRTAIGLGATNDVMFQSVQVDTFSGVTNNVAIRFGGTNTGFFSGGISSGRPSLAYNGNRVWVADDTTFRMFVPVQFEDATSAATTRTNLGLPLPALTNTNNANFQAAVLNTNAAPTNSANVNTVNFNTAVAWMEVHVFTNGSNTSFRIPLFK